MVSKYHFDHSWISVNVTLNEIRRLQRDRRYRDERGAFFIEGVRNFVQAADYHYDLIVNVYSEKLLTALLARKLIRQFRRAGIPIVRVSPEKFR
jgi:TrmH family RNA methyltransferase